MTDALHNDEELILRYLDGEMEEEERGLFEERLRREPALKDRLESLQTAITAVQQYGTATKVKAIHKEMVPQLGGTGGRVVSMKKIIRYTMAVAASVLLIFLAIRFIDNNQFSAHDLYAEAFVPYDASTNRGEGGVSTVEELYRKGDYAAVVRNADDDTLLSGRDNLLVGISYLQLDSTTASINRLRPMTQANGVVRLDAQFYLALAYLKMGDYDKAVDMMNTIHNDPAHPYREQFSEKYIEKVKKLK